MSTNVTNRLSRTAGALGLALVATVALGWLTPARADDAAPAAPPAQPAPPPPAKDPACGCSFSPSDLPPDRCPCPSTCIPDPLFHGGCLDCCIDKWQKAKEDQCFSIGAGAYHWFNYNVDSGDFTYGYPNGGEGTYFYYLNVDLACPRCNECAPQWGGHVQLRFRDETLFRSFFTEQVWFYEAYASLDLPTIGTFKAGKIWKRFGYDWDGTFWGNVPYYDGMKLDPDWGVSWERVWYPGKRLEINAFAQFFLKEDIVNGSIAGADPESTGVFDEENTFVARVQPRYRFDKNTSVAVGLSALFGQVTDQVGTLGDDELFQYAVDAEFQWCGLKAFAEYAH